METNVKLDRKSKQRRREDGETAKGRRHFKREVLFNFHDYIILDS